MSTDSQADRPAIAGPVPEHHGGVAGETLNAELARIRKECYESQRLFREQKNRRDGAFNLQKSRLEESKRELEDARKDKKITVESLQKELDLKEEHIIHLETRLDSIEKTCDNLQEESIRSKGRMDTLVAENLEWKRRNGELQEQCLKRGRLTLELNQQLKALKDESKQRRLESLELKEESEKRRLQNLELDQLLNKTFERAERLGKQYSALLAACAEPRGNEEAEVLAKNCQELNGMLDSERKDHQITRDHHEIYKKAVLEQFQKVQQLGLGG